MATIEELEIAGATAFANNDLDAAQYFADEIKALQSANVDSEESLLDTTKVLADDFSNQFNNSIATLAGAPVDLISFGLNKVSNAIADRDIVTNPIGGSESIRKVIQGLSLGAPVRDEPARTKAGLVGQVAGETASFTLPILKVAQVASKTQATTKAGNIGVNLAKQFTDEATKNTGRFLAVESGAVAGASAGRILQEEKDLSPGAAVAVEVLTGLTGALAGDKTFGLSKALINKSKGKTAQEIMENVASGNISYKDLTFTPAERPLFKQDGTFNIDESLPITRSETKPIINFRKDGIPYEIEGTYIRFGELPKGPSRNFITGKQELGHSVYPAYFDPKTKKYIIVGNPAERGIGTLDRLIAGVADGEIGEGRKIYQISGKRISTGQDGEPILDVTTSKQLKEIKRSDVVLQDEPYQDIDLNPIGKEASFNIDDATIKFPKGFKLAKYTFKKSADGNFKIFKDGKIVDDPERLLGRSKISSESEAKKLIEHNIDEDLIDFNIAQKKTPSMPGIVRQNFDEARREIVENLLATQRTQLAIGAGNLNNYAPGSKKKPTRLFNRINSWLAPSKVVGRGILNEIEQAKGIIREAESVGIRTYNAVERIKKANPNDAAAIDKNVNDFLLGGELDPLLVPIRTELSAWRTSPNKLQERLIGAMDDQAFMDLSPEIREGLRRAIEDSMEDNAGYLTTPYRLFEDPDYKPTKQQEDAAFKEIQLNLMESGVPSVKASELARKKINDLKGNSAKTRELESNRGIRPVASESILRQRTFPGPAERAWLGEITEAGQRALITSRRLSRLASAKAEDAEIANLLLDSGVATRTAREGTVELKLKTVSGNTNIYVNPEVADSIYKLRYGQMVNQGVRNIGAKLLDAFFTANFFAKFTKVILNVGSYPVAALGAITSTLSNAAIPNFSGLRKAAAGFRSLENFVAGKTPDAKKKFYAELDKMDLYNLRPKSVDAADMEATLKRGFRIFDKFLSAQKVIDIGGKAYSAAAVALRYTTWKATQKHLAKDYPDYTTEQIEAAAARMVNDTFPNYDKLSDVVRAGSRLILQPFIAHFAELSRVSYNQGKFALQMLRGNFGRDFGLDPARANKSAMRILGTTRLGAFAVFTAGAKVLVNQKNEESGLDDNSVQAFKQSVLPFWMEATTPIIKPNKDNPRRGVFVPPEYLIPQLAMADTFSAAINGQPFEDSMSILKNRIFSEGGSLALQSLTKITTGRDERGREIYIDPSFFAKTKVVAESLFDDIVKPGTFRTYERFSDSINEIGDRTVAQEVQSLFGYRVYTYDADVSFRSKFRQQSTLMNRAKGDYTSAFRERAKGDISQQDLESTYNQVNTARKNRLDLARGHYENMAVEPLNYTLDEKIAIMKEGGLSSLDILDIIGGTYTDMPRNITDKTKDRYDEIPGNLKAKGRAILSLPKSDPYRQKLGEYHKKQVKAEGKNIDAVDSLIISLTPEQTADYLIKIGADKNPKILKEYLRKDPSALKIQEILKVRSSN